MIICEINHLILIVNFRNCFDKALTEIFQFHRALLESRTACESGHSIVGMKFIQGFEVDSKSDR